MFPLPIKNRTMEKEVLSGALFYSLSAYPEKPDAIDWDYYKKNLSKANYVEEFQKKYEALSIAYPKDTESVKIDDKEKSWVRILKHVVAYYKVISCIYLSVGRDVC